MTQTAEPVLIVEHLSKTYTLGDQTVRALDDVSLTVAAGEFVALVGASGSGKSTLLNLVGGIDQATAGSIRLAGHDVTKLGDWGLTELRRSAIGVVFQFFNLMPTLSVIENVTLPALLAGGDGAKAADARATELLDAVGLSARRLHKPHELSGGEMQRVAIARALMNDPAVLLCDEPTGNLDSHTGQTIIALLGDLNRRLGKTLVMATHSAEAAGAATRIVTMKDGRILTDTAATLAA